VSHPTDVDPDSDCVARCKAGDRAAFRQLVEKYHPEVFRIVSGMIRDADEADDVSQEVFLKIHRSLDRFMGQSRFSVWLYRVAVNQCLDNLKSRKRRPETVTFDDFSEEAERAFHALFADPSPNAAEGLEEEQLQSAVQRMILSLAPEQRVVVTLKDMEGMSQEEIANILGCPVGTVKSRLTRARETLKERLRPFYEAWKSGG